MNMEKSQLKSDGMTIVELLVVILVIGILAGLGVGLSKIALQKNAMSKVTADLQQLSNALNDYRIDNNTYPQEKTIEEVKELLEDYDNGITYSDPWGNLYLYRSKTKFVYELISVGPDGEEGTADDIKYE